MFLHQVEDHVREESNELMYQMSENSLCMTERPKGEHKAKGDLKADCNM